jgi:hypothetical protein
MLRNTKAQILMAEQSKNYERAYRLALNAVDETSRMLTAMANYAQSKQTALASANE